MIDLKNKDDVGAVYGLASMACFLMGIFYAFDSFNSSAGVVWMLGAIVINGWKKEQK